VVIFLLGGGEGGVVKLLNTDRMTSREFSKEVQATISFYRFYIRRPEELENFQVGAQSKSIFPSGHFLTNFTLVNLNLICQLCYQVKRVSKHACVMY